MQPELKTPAIPQSLLRMAASSNRAGEAVYSRLSGGPLGMAKGPKDEGHHGHV